MRKLLNGSVIITLILFVDPFSTKGQTDSLKEQMQPIEVKAVRAGTDAPFVKTDITAKEIEKQNLGQDLPILLQYIPSAVITSDAGSGVGYTGIHIRGTDPTRINITMNGIPVNDPEEQAAYFVDFPDIASSASSVQIQRGVGTSTNGAGAFGATISIDNIQQMDSAGAMLSSSTGSFNTWKNTLCAGTGLLKNGWQFDIRLSKINSDGYIQRGSSDLRSLQLNATWNVNKNTALHFMIMTGTEKTGQSWNGVPQDSLNTNRTYNGLGIRPDGTYYNNQTDNYEQDYYQVFADHKFSQSITGHIGLFLTRGIGYYEEYVTDHLSNYGFNFGTGVNDSSDVIRQKWLDNYYYGTVFSLLWNKNKTKYTLGGGFTQFENLHYGIMKWTSFGSVPDNYEWYKNDAQKNDINLYAKSETKLGACTILFGELQYRTIAYFINGYDDNPAIRKNVNYNFFNPKAGITYLLQNTSSEKEKVYASVAVAHREADRADFETDSVNLPKSEQLIDVEAGYEVQRNTWRASANLYYMSYKDQLVLTGQINDVGAYTQTNVPNSYRAGLELQAAVQLYSWFSANANVTISQNKIGEFSEYIDNYDNGNQNIVKHTNTDIAFSPNLVSAIVLNFKPFQIKGWRHLEVGIADKYISMQYLDNTANNNRSLPAYNYCNLLFRYSLKLFGLKEFTATLAINNIFNTYYSSNGNTYSHIAGGTLITSNNYFPQAGTNIIGGVTLKW